jgi:hypothetical protein
MWRQRDAPNVLRCIKPNAAMQGLARIDVHDRTSSTLVGQNDIHFNPHPDAQRHSTQKKCAMEVNDESLALAGDGFCDAPRSYLNFETDPSASSGVANKWTRRIPPSFTSRRSYPK